MNKLIPYSIKSDFDTAYVLMPITAKFDKFIFLQYGT